MTRWLVVAALAACGAGHRDPDHVHTSCDAYGASDDRTAFAYLDDDRLIVRTATETHTLRRPACIQKVNHLYVSPHGDVVAAWGEESNIPMDMWGHSGKHTVTECAVRTRDSSAVAFTQDGAFVWFGGETVPVRASDRPVDSRTCRTWSSSSGALVACIEGGVLSVRRFKDQHLAHDTDQSWPVAKLDRTPDFQISPDGKRLAYWTDELHVVDLTSGAELMQFRDVGRAEQVELDPAGRDQVMIVGTAYEFDTSVTRRIRIVGFDGVLRKQQSESGADRTVFWTAPDAYWVGHFCGVDRVLIR